MSPAIHTGPLHLPQPVTRPDVDGELFDVMEDYLLSRGIPGYSLLIKKGFKFDGASIPRVFWLTTGYPMSPGFQAAGLVHDGIYAAELMSQKEADDLFYWCLRQDGVNWYTANKMWLAVRIGGGVVWHGHTPESVREARKYCQLIPLVRSIRAA